MFDPLLLTIINKLKWWPQSQIGEWLILNPYGDNKIEISMTANELHVIKIRPENSWFTIYQLYELRIGVSLTAHFFKQLKKYHVSGHQNVRLKWLKFWRKKNEIEIKIEIDGVEKRKWWWWWNMNRMDFFSTSPNLFIPTHTVK